MHVHCTFYTIWWLKMFIEMTCFCKWESTCELEILLLTIYFFMLLVKRRKGNVMVECKRNCHVVSAVSEPFDL